MTPMNEALTRGAPPATRLDELRAGLRANASAPLEEARALPAGCYEDADFHALERAAIFEREWLPLAHVSQIPRAGDYLALDVLDEPLLVVRGKDERIRVLSRVCQHRGMDMMPPGHADASGSGNLPALRCPYHLWTYDLGGQLLAAPEMQGSHCHARGRVGLREFRSEVFEGFVFMNFDTAAAPVGERYAGLAAGHLGKCGLGEATLVWQREWDCAFNWKVLVENFMEPYHHMGAHRSTLQPLMPALGCWTDGAGGDDWLAVHLPLTAQLRDEVLRTRRPAPGFTPFPGLALEDHLEWWVFLGQPLFLMFTAPDRAFWYRLLPTGPDTCRLLTTMLVAKDAPQAPDFAAWLARAEEEAIAFHLEDMVVCSGVQRGVRSRAYVQGALSRLEEPILRVQRYLAQRLA
jgi:phenylpropionate dioxygenase-like ring-hydroxylating dioxygenase large terminal subunit